MARPWERQVDVLESDGMVCIQLTLVRNQKVAVYPLWVTPFEAGQLSAMLGATVREMVG